MLFQFEKPNWSNRGWQQDVIIKPPRAGLYWADDHGVGPLKSLWAGPLPGKWDDMEQAVSEDGLVVFPENNPGEVSLESRSWKQPVTWRSTTYLIGEQHGGCRYVVDLSRERMKRNASGFQWGFCWWELNYSEGQQLVTESWLFQRPWTGPLRMLEKLGWLVDGYKRHLDQTLRTTWSTRGVPWAPGCFDLDQT